ncbi:transketolase family protein [bacterium]|nr:transketolase family protein [bacterium]
MAAKEMRAVYAETLIELAAVDRRIMVVEADLMRASGTIPFRDAYPDRAVDVGVAEANLVGVAAGLAAEGKVPFAATFGCFASRRAFDQFFVSCAYAKLPVKLVGTDPGISAAYNGGTHMPFEDIGVMRTVPGLDIVEPSDPLSLKALVGALAASNKPGYLRLHRKAIEPIYGPAETFALGKGKLLREGGDVLIVALGAILVPAALAAAKALEAEGISAAVIDALSAKPIDAELILAWAKKAGAVVTAENHQLAGGFGSAVAELLAETGTARLARVGVEESFGEVGTQDYLAKRFGLTAEAIALKAKNLLKTRN